MLPSRRLADGPVSANFTTAYRKQRHTGKERTTRRRRISHSYVVSIKDSKLKIRNADKKEPAWISDPRPAHLEGIQDWLSVTAMAAASAETVASAKTTAETVAAEARVSAKTTAGCEAPRDAAAEARRSGAHGHHAWGPRHHA